MRKLGKELVKDSYEIVTNLFFYDLIIYAVITITPTNMDALYSQFYKTCENAVSFGNTAQIFGIGAAILVGMIVILQAVQQLGWLSLLIIRQLLSDAAKMAVTESDIWSQISNIAGSITMANLGFKTFGVFIYNNWFLLASLAAFIRILPFDFGKRGGNGLLAFAVFNYLLIPFYPTFRDIFTFFMRETYPAAAYFPLNYVIIDGVFLGLYVGFIIWLIAGVSRLSFGLGALIPAAEAMAVISWAKEATQTGLDAIQEAASAIKDLAQQESGVQSQMMQSIGAVREEIMSLPIGEEMIKGGLLTRLDQLESWVKGISTQDLNNKDATLAKLEGELRDIRNIIDTTFYGKEEIPKVTPVTSPTRFLDTGEMVNKYERERIQPWVDEVLGPHPHEVSAAIGNIQIFTKEGDVLSSGDAKFAAHYIENNIPEEHRSFVNRIFVNSNYSHYHEGVKGTPLGEAYQRPDGKTDIFLYRNGASPSTIAHEAGHGVEHSFTGRQWAEWEPIHMQLRREIPPDHYQYRDPTETFANSYDAWANNKPLPDNVKSFFDHNVVNRRYVEPK